MAKVIKALRVERDLEIIWDFIAADNPDAAEQCLRRIDSLIQKLALSPFIGRSRDDLGPGIRSIPVGNYLIFFRPISRKNGVTIVRVIEGHRNVTPEAFE